MLLDSRIVPETIAKPRTFVGLMALYESNYVRLLHLLPDLATIDGCHRSRVAGDCDLHVDVLDRGPYTVTLSLTYYFETEQGRVADPDMRVRAYLDGKLAESMRVSGNHQHAELKRLFSAHSQELDARWRRNMVLNKWLEYLSDQGHLVLDR
jgi:uncharacterized protein YqiB (DUF1249 family)